MAKNKKTIGLIFDPYEYDQFQKGRTEKYKKAIQKIGADFVLFENKDENWIERIKKLDEKCDCFYWHSINRGKFVREEVLDKVYFIDKYLKHKIFPDFNQYYVYDDKVKQFKLFKLHNVPTPKTFYTKDKNEALKFVNKTKYPFVLKDPHSAGGLGVFLIKNKKEAKKIVQDIFSNSGYNSIYYQMYVQEFIADLDRSLRIITIGDKIYCAYWRISPGEWKNHYVRGNDCLSQKNIPKSALKMSLDFSKRMKYHWMAYDVLVKYNKNYIIEYTCNFGMSGAEELGYDPRGEMLKYVLKKS